MEHSICHCTSTSIRYRTNGSRPDKGLTCSRKLHTYIASSTRHSGGFLCLRESRTLIKQISTSIPCRASGSYNRGSTTRCNKQRNLCSHTTYLLRESGILF